MRLCGLAVLAIVLGCSDPLVSQVMVQVDADEVVRTRAASLVIRVAGGGRERGQVTNCEDGSACQVHYEELPIDALPVGGLLLALAPDKRDWRRLYEASVTAYEGPNGTGVALATTRVISGYVRGETRTIRLFLQGSCIGELCDPETTCRDGTCVDPFVPPDTLDPFVPPDAGTDGAMDAGVDAATCSGAADCDDGVDCTFDDCVAGSCENAPRDSMCADPENPCLDAVCDATDGCTTAPNVATCDDGNVCNGPEQCEAGACVNQRMPRCPAPLTCETDGTCTGCTGGDCPGTQVCVDGTCECGEVPFQAMETACSDGIDNDCDGMIDCEDPGCIGRNLEVCDMSTTDEDCDGSFDEGCIETNCTNGVDDDVDGVIDCDDDDCTGRSCMRSGTGGTCSAITPGCCRVSRPEGCGVTEDWNCDGVTMSACMDGSVGDGSPEASFDGGDGGFGDTMDECMMMTEICNNDVDDNCNGLVDCQEPSDCEGMPCNGGTGTCMGAACIPNGGDGSTGLEVGVGEGGA